MSDISGRGGFSMSRSPQSTRGWRQFSLRTLLAAILVAGCLMGWVAYERGLAADQQAAYKLIIAKRGLTNFGPQSARSPWVRAILGEDVAAEGGCVEFGDSSLTDDDIARLCSLRSLQRLSLQKNPITDKGLLHLSKLPRLKYLSLDETNITDTGLKSLHGCESLELLTLYGTRTTDAGVQALRTARPNVNVVDAADNDWPPLNSASP
jgi:hypothetical protein